MQEADDFFNVFVRFTVFCLEAKYHKIVSLSFQAFVFRAKKNYVVFLHLYFK
jgi:hypothetical protein